jgi:menaquinone-9 beta-reductase
MGKNDFQVGIIGGGLAGLSLAILLAKQKISVVLFEKGDFPAHKVCGEYLSKESLDFLNRIGIDLFKIDLPQIEKLVISSPNNTQINTSLPLGAIGISRFQLDEMLYRQALKCGVAVWTKTKVFKIETGAIPKVHSSAGVVNVQQIISASGKLNLLGLSHKNPTLDNYVGVKYHISLDAPKDTIFLFPFTDGYAGMSAIEDHKFCLCYLTKASSLMAQNGKIDQLEEQVLQQNIALRNVLNTATHFWEKPITISNVYFGKKCLFHDGVFFLGDAAGSIPPLAGNGMSMALRSAHLLAPIIDQVLQQQITLQNGGKAYEKLWDANFNARIKSGLRLQKLMSSTVRANLGVSALKKLPFIHNYLIKSTHGIPF